MIADETRSQTADALRAWLARHGEPQMRLAPADAVRGGWRRHAACGQDNGGPDPELFHPLSADSDDTYAAQSYCLRCPVRQYCDDYATSVGEVGMWGGLFRDGSGRFAALCASIGCMNYRTAGQRHCRDCSARSSARTRPAAAVLTEPALV